MTDLLLENWGNNKHTAKRLLSHEAAEGSLLEYCCRIFANWYLW